MRLQLFVIATSTILFVIGMTAIVDERVDIGPLFVAGLLCAAIAAALVAFKRDPRDDGRDGTLRVLATVALPLAHLFIFFAAAMVAE